jgi:hypothetical protein
MRIIRNLTGLLFGIVIGTMLVLSLMPRAHSAEPTQRPPPLASFVVMQCGEVVVAWVITPDNKAYRTDAEHHPEANEYKAFLAWLATGQSDLYTLPCKQ